jgi:nitroreductase
MRRLDPDRPVSEADLRTLLEAATKGASGGNSQRARWLVVTDPERKRALGEVYRRCAETILRGYEERSDGSPEMRRMLSSSWHLADHFGEAPALIVACCRGPEGRFASSVFPGVQNLMLAARALGLGTTLTTIHLCDEAAVKQVLGIPEDVATYCIVPVGHPLGRWGEARRRPVEEVAYRDAWGEPFPA